MLVKARPQVENVRLDHLVRRGWYIASRWDGRRQGWFGGGRGKKCGSGARQGSLKPGQGSPPLSPWAALPPHEASLARPSDTKPMLAASTHPDANTYSGVGGVGVTIIIGWQAKPEPGWRSAAYKDSGQGPDPPFANPDIFLPGTKYKSCSKPFSIHEVETLNANKWPSGIDYLGDRFRSLLVESLLVWLSVGRSVIVTNHSDNLNLDSTYMTRFSNEPIWRPIIKLANHLTAQFVDQYGNSSKW